jgi:FixJ family two-component response regulator
MNVSAAVIHIVDDDPSIRTSVGRLLRIAGYRVVLHDSANHLVQNLPEMERGCILLDVRMPGLSGPQVQDELAKMNFEMPIIFLTGHGDFPTSVKAIKAGAEDFLAKPTPRKLLLETIERALQRYDDRHEQNVRLGIYRARLNTLTPREREVFDLVVRGKLNKQIGHELGTSERTIKAHRSSCRLPNISDCLPAQALTSRFVHRNILDVTRQTTNPF